MVIVYALECAVTGFSYIGCTAGKPGKRMREHRCLLNKGKHSATKMVADWQQYGEQSFTFKVIESLPDGADVAAKRAAELYWQNKYASEGRLYNPIISSFNFPSKEAQAKGIEAS